MELLGVYQILEWENITVGRMIIHPANPDLIIAAASNGIYKTTNAGANWLKTSYNSNNYKDIAINPTAPTNVYASEGGKFYRSTNTGDTWVEVTLPITGNRAVIGVKHKSTQLGLCCSKLMDHLLDC